MLTLAGSLLVGSLRSVYSQQQSIMMTNVGTISVDLLGSMSNGISVDRTMRVKELIQRVRNLAGVEAVALTAYELLDRAYVRSWFTAPLGAVDRRQVIMVQAVTADFYGIIQPQLVAGRWPTPTELSGDQPVIVISEKVAKNYWPNGSALGQTLTDQGPGSDASKPFTVVGVVKDIRWYSWDAEAQPMIYGPYALLARQGSSVFMVRTSRQASRVTSDVLVALRSADRLLRIGRVQPLEALFVDSVRPRRLQAWLFGSFAAVGVFVVGLGMFGPLAMSAARRRREVGIRLACGATPAGIVRLILREQLVPVIVGLVLGGIGGAWSVRFLASYLYQITPADPRIWASAVGLILFTAAAGTLAPTLRASQIDPTEVLRA